jgi:uncharacterized membrane protein SpoIIM required for sporulation
VSRDPLLTKSERFIRERKERWQRFSGLAERAAKSPSSLSADDVRDFPRLYRACCADLARARTLRLAPDIIAYLNDAAARGHAALYGRPPVRAAALRRFLSRELPRAVSANAFSVIAAALLFLVPYFACLALSRADPSVAERFVPRDTLEEFASYYQGELEGRSAGGSSFMTAFYVRNNVSIAFLSFATGILACLGSAYFLVYNGLFLGAIEGYIVYSGYGPTLHAFTLAHAPLEMTGLVLAGAAGLSLGYAVLKGGRYRRADALVLVRKRIFPLIAAFVSCIGCAAFIEGFLSPHDLPIPLKAAVAIVTASALGGYFLVWPAVLALKEKRR